MSDKFSKILEPIKIGTVEIKNRIAMAPMGILGLTNPDGSLTKRGIDYYVERARGGTGLIITGAFKVECEIDACAPNILFSAASLTSFAELAETVHAFGSKIFVQLTAGFGRSGHPMMLLKQPVAPSAIPNYWNPNITCRELKTEEVEHIVKCFGEAAEICAMADIDGVEIHAVHEGYLLDQFTIAFFNRRTDKYGGDLMGRLTFPIEIVREIKNKVGKNFPVALRFSVKSYIKDWRQGGLPNEDFEEKGRDVEEGLKVAKILEAAGYDAFDADAGTYDAWYWAHPPTYQEHGCYLPLIEKLRKVIKAPIIVAGRMELPELAEKVLEEGTADMIGIGRGLLTDPYWVKKVEEDRVEDIVPCTGCHDGCLGRIFLGRPLSCAINPAVGRESDYRLEPANNQKNVMCIGGGVAGLEAARVAAIRGHKVTLYEKSNNLGGHLIEVSIPKFKEDYKRLLDWYKIQLKKLNVDIKLNTEVTFDLIKKEKPDVTIIATGSKPIIPVIPGIEKDKVATATDVLLGNKEVGEKVVVVGGGLVGCETALWLAQQGKKVTIVEMLNDLMIAGLPVPHANRIMLIDLLKFNKVEVITNHSLMEVTDEGVNLIDKNFKKISVPGDNVVLAIGLKPNKELYDNLVGKVPNLYLIGDARDVRNVMYSIWDAYELARVI
ncbi:MAG TPA: FAD-dependent oxidoreductase [Caldisericia bacterium]|nr:FAD-dependent oxidoreductase [Caldisericia bacterium]HQL66226.1 FAD-dependent oxidoreductase [Caldisericia bacterium]